MFKSQLPDVYGHSKEDDGGFEGSTILAMGLITILLAIGLAGVVYGLIGVSGAVLLMSAALIIGVIWSFVTLFRGMGEQVGISTNDGELLSQLVGLNRRATVMTDLRGRRLTYNAAYEAFTDGKVYELDDLIKGEDSQREFRRLVTLIRRKSEGEALFASSQGREAEVTLSGKRIERFILWEVRGEGVDARIKREIGFIKSRAQPFLTMLGCGVAVEDAAGHVRYVNDVLAGWLSLKDGEDLPKRLPLKDNNSVLVSPYGHQIHVESMAMPLETREGENSIGQVRLLYNLERNRLTRFGKASTAFIDPAFDTAPIGIAVVSSDGAIAEYNRTFAKYLQGAAASATPSLVDVVDVSERQQLLAHLSETADGRAPAKPMDVTLIGTKERTGQVHLSSVHTGKERFVVAYIVDTTQERQLEQQFVQAQKMQAVGQLAGGIAHDFNNLLTAIIGFCDLLLMRYDTGDQSYFDLIQIKQNANRAAGLVRQLLAFSRQQTMRPQVLEMTDVLAELLHLIQRLIGDRITLEVTHGRDLARIKVDQGQFEQVIINLAVNARDAMPGGGKLSIKTRMVETDDAVFDEFDVLAPGRYVEVEVSDTGTGISKEHLDKIFEPFFTTKAVGEGTGLGLATVYGIVKQSGGYVFCRSAVGVGTSFIIFLEAFEGASEVVADAAKEKEAQDLTGSSTILLVEDEDPVRMFASRALSTKGYHVIEAASGEQALEVIESGAHDISLLITDVVMPEMDGPELAEKARKLNAALPVIFISGYAEDVLRKELESPHNHFLAKPFSLQALAEMVKSIDAENK